MLGTNPEKDNLHYRAGKDGSVSTALTADSLPQNIDYLLTLGEQNGLYKADILAEIFRFVLLRAERLPQHNPGADTTYPIHGRIGSLGGEEKGMSNYVSTDTCAVHKESLEKQMSSMKENLGTKLDYISKNIETLLQSSNEQTEKINDINIKVTQHDGKFDLLTEKINVNEKHLDRQDTTSKWILGLSVTIAATMIAPIAIPLISSVVEKLKS